VLKSRLVSNVFGHQSTARPWVLAILVSLVVPAWAASSISGKITIVDTAGNAVGDQSGTVIFLEGSTESARQQLRSAPSPASVQKISHKGMNFSPRVIPLKTGSSVDFLNDDGIFHNAFSLSRSNPFDLGVYPQGTSKLVRFDKPGLVRVYCNLHPGMVSNVLALDNHFFAMTDATGQYSLSSAPVGSFVFRVWSERADPSEQSIEISTDTPLRLDRSLVAHRQFSAHRNKFGKPYRAKY
jgi:plastocyanin